MTGPDLGALYRRYLDCLNRRDWDRLGEFVHEGVSRNGERLGLRGYRAMLERDCATIPDLHFAIERLAVEPPHVASRLAFDCSPRGTFLGMQVDGGRLRFAENVFYEYREGRILTVWSIVDKAAVEAQIGGEAAG